jgi:hypothetical protein
MKLLEELYLIKLQIPKYFKNRKKFITLENSIINGIRFSGKSYIIYELFNNIDESLYLYINLNDLRVNNINSEQLDNFIRIKKIEYLIIENYDINFNLPKNTINILTTTKKIFIENYKNISLFPLDFEEFLAFENKTHSIKHSFNDFLKSSTFPSLINLSQYEQHIKLQDKIKLISNSQIKENIFQIMIESTALKLSLVQIFNKLKESIKISKDKFYEITKELENENYIFLINKYNQPKAQKKIYTIDAQLKNAFSFNKKFQAYYENLVFCEILKKEVDIFYTDYLNFFIPSQSSAIIAKAFFDIDVLENTVKKLEKHIKELEINSLYIVTTSDEHKIFIKQNLEVIVIPFWEWALL